MLPVETAFKIYTGLDGKPLDGGYVYFGQPNQNPITAPVTVYWDAAGTQPAAQPLRTENGYIVRVSGGTPANVFYSTSYSQLVQDSKRRQVYFARNSDDYSIATIVNNLLANLISSIGSSIIGFIQAGVDAVARNAQDKMRESVSVLDFMPASLAAVAASGTYTTQNRLDMYAAVVKAWNYVLSAKKDLLFPAGKYDIGADSFPWRQQGAVSSLLDCFDICIYGDGPSSIMMTTSLNGADVFQLNGVKNLHFRNMSITAELTGSAGAGSNGISVTGGWDNVSVLDVWVYDAPSLDKTSYVDGGKALTFQPPGGGSAVTCGAFEARIFVRGCAEGVGVELDLSTASTKNMTIDVDITAEDCFYAVKVVGAEATAALPVGMTTGVTIRAQAINCQKDLILNRAHGVDVEVQVVTNKTEAARRLNPSGSTWFAADTVVESVFCGYAKNSRVQVTGNKGACAYKARIGATTAGSSGLGGQTEYSDIYLDIGGTASVADIDEVNSGGSTMSNSCLFASNVTCTTLPAAYHIESLANDLSIGTARRCINTSFSGTLRFLQESSGTIVTGSVDMGGPSGLVTVFRGQGTATGNAPIAGFADNSNTVRFGIVNGNGIMIDGLTSLSAVGAYKGKFAVYDTSGVFIGWLPIHD